MLGPKAQHHGHFCRKVQARSTDVENHRDRPDGTYVALDVSYRYKEVAKVSSEVRKRAADALAASTDAAAVLLAGRFFEEFVDGETRLVAEWVFEEWRRAEEEARQRAIEEMERNSTEFFFIQVVSGAGLPAGSSCFVQVAVCEQEPFRTMAVWGEEPVWGEVFASHVPKARASRRVAVSLLDDRSIVGQVRATDPCPPPLALSPPILGEMDGGIHPASPSPPAVFFSNPKPLSTFKNGHFRFFWRHFQHTENGHFGGCFSSNPELLTTRRPVR